MSINSYEGLVIGGYRDYEITESSIRPAACRFEAHLKEPDGEASLFGATIEDLQAEIDDKYFEEDMDDAYDGIEDALNGRR